MTLDLPSIRQAVSKAQGSRLHLTASLASLDSKIARSLEDIVAFEDVQRLIQETAQEVQEEMRIHLQEIPQHALDAIFPGVYTFRVEFATSKGRTAARLLLEKGGNVMDDILDCEGGGVVQIIATALRIAVWTLAPTAPIMLFDEPGVAVSAEYKAVFAEIIRGLAGRLGMQLLIVSHDPVYIAAADRIHKVTQGPDGRSHVTYEDADV